MQYGGTISFPILYKKAVNEKISSWTVCIIYPDKAETATIKITHGFIDGGKQVEIIEIKEGKNLGRSNETSVLEQARAEAKSRWKKQLDRGYTEDPSGITKMEVILPMLAQKYYDTVNSRGDITRGRHKHMLFPCYAQPKLNGARCISYIKEGKRVYQSRLGKFWTTLSHLDESLEVFDEDIIIDGEIYIHGMDLQDILSLIKNQDTSLVVGGFQAKDLEYHIYDIVSEEPFHKRIIQLIEYCSNLPINSKVQLVKTKLCCNKLDVKKFFNEYKEFNYEGAMLRNKDGAYAKGIRSNNLQKVKTSIEEEFQIIGGYCVDTGREEGTCIFTCITKNNKAFDVRPKGTIERRKQYWKDIEKLKGKMLTVEFQELTSDGKPFHARGIAIRDYE